MDRAIKISCVTNIMYKGFMTKNNRKQNIFYMIDCY